MRVNLAVALVSLCVGHVSLGVGNAVAEDANVQPLSWQVPFATISASKADRALVLVLITNEDPFRYGNGKGDLREDDGKGDDPMETATPSVWCVETLSQSCREVLQRRDDLRDRLTLQSVVAGLPREVTGGVSRNAPARAVLAVCDGNYRLLSLMVGVPNTDDLSTLIEDAEDVSAMLQAHKDDPNERVDQLVQRSNERLSRIWRLALADIAASMRGTRDDQNDEVAESERLQVGGMRLLSETFEPTYLADVRLRFGLNDASDQTRLVILEQHPQTRWPWCQATIPLVAGSDFSLQWRELVDSVWGHPPVTAEDPQSELLEWVDGQLESNAVVLSLAPSDASPNMHWPPNASDGSRRAIGWREVHAQAQTHPFRTVGVQQLALVIRSTGLVEIDIYRPAIARYVLLEPKKRTAQVIRESDPPGRFAGLLKRTKSRLVKN